MDKRIGILLAAFLLFFFIKAYGEPYEGYKNFSFRISGLYGNVEIGDFNTILKDTELYYDILFSPYDFIKDKDLEIIDYAWGFKAEFLMRFTKHFGLGVETGYIHQSLNPDVSWENTELGIFTLNTKSQMYLIPVVLNGYGYLPLNPRMSIYIMGGPGIYMVQTQYEYVQNSQISGEEAVSGTEFNSQGSSYGLEGGIGLEIKLSSSTSLYIEGKGRYVNVNKLTGRLSSWPGLFATRGSGDIWYFDYFDEYLSQYISGLKYGEKPEADEIKNVRRLNIDLSGFYIGVGLRIRVGNWE